MRILKKQSPPLTAQHSLLRSAETADLQEGFQVKAWASGRAAPALTSHIWSWKRRRSFSISSAISAPVISVRIIPCCFACSLFSFSIFVNFVS